MRRSLSRRLAEELPFTLRNQETAQWLTSPEEKKSALYHWQKTTKRRFFIALVSTKKTSRFFDRTPSQKNIMDPSF